VLYGENLGSRPNTIQALLVTPASNPASYFSQPKR
jgi:hypothetical protein